MLALFIVQLLNVVKITCQIEGKIVHGDRVEISQFAHSAFLFIRSEKSNFVCGASIVNQRILLTAAHCIEHCVNKRCRNGSAFVGHSEKYKGIRFPLRGFIVHENYDCQNVVNDIGLVAIQEQFKLGEFVQRVSIIQNPSYFDVVAIAGWGLIDEMQNIHTHYLHEAKQKIWPLEECRKIIHSAPNGSFCGGSIEGLQYPSDGDSGSALIADNYIQLGLVSYKIPEIARSVVIYTDVPFFYNWIQENSKKLHCLSIN